MRLPVFACPQRLLELLFVQPDLTGQPGQHVDLADVLPSTKNASRMRWLYSLPLP
jgi:hypothetical protein